MDHSSSHLRRNRSMRHLSYSDYFCCSLLRYLFFSAIHFYRWMVNYVFPILFRFSQLYCICRTRIVCLFIFLVVPAVSDGLENCRDITHDNIQYCSRIICFDSSLFGGNYFFSLDYVKGINVPAVLSRCVVLCLLLLMVYCLVLLTYTWFCLQFYRSMCASPMSPLI